MAVELIVIVNIIAVLLSPVIAVCVTLWWQSRKEKRDAKIRLFTTLMAFRKSYPISYEWANALNLIDVVFSGCPKVVDRWHKYYDNLHDQNPRAIEMRVHKYLELMSEMAAELGFQNLQQTDIDKFYVPQAHGNQADLNAACQTEWLRVLKNTSRFETSPNSPQPVRGRLDDIPLPTASAPQRQVDQPERP